MKTIEQAAKENADKKFPKIGLNDDWKDDGFDEGYDAAMHNKSIEEFKAGVEFAQQWIPVEKELPENDERVLTKFENGKVIVNSFDIHLGKWQYEFDKEYTHWRPVSFL